MAVPRKRLTKRRQGTRRSQAHGKFEIKQPAICSNCNSTVMPHRVCSSCGFYKGKKILNIFK
jgi:large subunit ribosomal protein L32